MPAAQFLPVLLNPVQHLIEALSEELRARSAGHASSNYSEKSNRRAEEERVLATQTPSPFRQICRDGEKPEKTVMNRCALAQKLMPTWAPTTRASGSAPSARQ